MKNKGFTLIELLAVIVILAIIALIAVPIVLGIINDAKKESNERSIELYGSAVEQAVARYQLNTGLEPTSFSDLTIEYDGNKVECETTKLNKNGTVYLADCKVDNVLVEGYTYGTNSAICTYQDGTEYEGNVVGEIDQNDLVTCAGESFHVMSNDGETITMLAQYNLDVGYILDITTWDWPEVGTEITLPTGKQNEEARGHIDGENTVYGILKFSRDFYWRNQTNDQYLIDADFINNERKYPYVYGDYRDENGNYLNNIYPHVLSYETYLKENGVNITSAKLISNEQLEALNCNVNDGSGIKACPDLKWIHTTSYWTGSASDRDIFSVNEGYIGITSPYACSDVDNEFNLGCNRVHGVRPVVTISVNEF